MKRFILIPVLVTLGLPLATSSTFAGRLDAPWVDIDRAAPLSGDPWTRIGDSAPLSGNPWTRIDGAAPVRKPNADLDTWAGE